MRKHNEINHELEEVFCNYCGKHLKTEAGIVKEGVVPVDITFGYFSDKDGQVHSLDLCEKCYDNLIQQFEAPVTIRQTNELL